MISLSIRLLWGEDTERPDTLLTLNMSGIQHLGQCEGQSQIGLVGQADLSGRFYCEPRVV